MTVLSVLLPLKSSLALLKWQENYARPPHPQRTLQLHPGQLPHLAVSVHLLCFFACSFREPDSLQSNEIELGAWHGGWLAWDP